LKSHKVEEGSPDFDWIWFWRIYEKNFSHLHFFRSDSFNDSLTKYFWSASSKHACYVYPVYFHSILFYCLSW
jgi:hypothetical protein